MHIDNNRPLFTLTVEEYISLHKEMRAEQPAPAQAPPQHQEDGTDLITAEECYKRLKITPMTGWRWRRLQKLPPSRSIGRRIYFSWAEVMAAMQQ